jgi:hypothetical protein
MTCTSERSGSASSGVFSYGVNAGQGDEQRGQQHEEAVPRRPVDEAFSMVSPWLCVVTGVRTAGDGFAQPSHPSSKITHSPCLRSTNSKAIGRPA